MKNKFLVKVCAIVLLLCMYSPLYLQAATELRIDDNVISPGTSEDTWSYDNDRLTLENYNGGPISATGDLTIIVKGNNSIIGDPDYNPESGNYGISVNGKLTIKGMTNQINSNYLTISNFTNGILVSNNESSDYTSVKIEYVTLNISNTRRGIFSQNSDSGSNDVKNTLNLANADVTISSDTYPLLIKGIGVLEGNLPSDYQLTRSTSGSDYYSVLTLGDSTETIKSVTIAPGYYTITYNLTNLALTTGSPANGAHLYYESSKGSQATQDFECGFDVIPSDYALPTQGIIVKIGGNELSPDLYSYNSTNGLVTISRSHITGDIEITAAAEPCDPNTQTGTLEEIVKLGLCLGLVGMVVLAKRLRLV